MKPLFSITIALLSALPTLAQDNCASAVPITAGTYVVPAVNGNQVPSPICAPNGAGASAGEWYSYTPASNYTVTINTAIGALTDSRVHVYLGGCGALACVAGDDDSGVNNTAFLTFNVAQQIAYLSERHTLLPGDIISTGVPQPSVPLKEGQTVEIVIQGLGTLRNKVVSKPDPGHVKFPARKVAKD